jgi:hypothetical protein
MKRTWMIPAALVAGFVGLSGPAHALSAEDGWRAGPGQMFDEEPGDYNWSSQRWRDDDRRGDDDRGPRWRDRDDDRRGDGDRGPRWRDRDDDRRSEGGRGPGWRGRDDDNCGPGMGRGMGRGMGPGMGRGMGPGMGRGMGRGYDERGYGGHYGHGGRHSMGRGFGGGHRHGRAGGLDQAEIDSIKKEIGITAAQEAAWTKYAGAVKEASDSAQKRREGMQAGAARGLSVEEFRKFRDLMIEQRRKEQDIVRAAVDELVKSLDEKQVAVAKEVLPGYAFGPGMRGAGMGWGGRNR